MKIGENRQSNFELLRIISMMSIVVFHCSIKSDLSYDYISIGREIVKSFKILGEFGVNVFILISGYFYQKSYFSFKKVGNIWGMIFFYELLSLSFFLIEGYSIDLNGKLVLELFIPITTGKYWFMTAYVLLYLFSPFLKITIENMKQEQYIKLLIMGYLVWCIWPTVTGIFRDTTEGLLYYSRFNWLILVYFTGAYINRFELQLLRSKKCCIIGMIGCSSVWLISILAIDLHREFWKMLGITASGYLWDANSIVCIGLSICVFVLFKNIKLSFVKWINVVSSTTLGIYLFHDGLLSGYLWNEVFRIEKYADEIWIGFYILFCACIVFIIGIALEFLRKKLKYIINMGYNKLKV